MSENSQAKPEDVPPKPLPQSKPCNPETRIPSSVIIIRQAEDSDVPAIATAFDSCFETWWVKHEPTSIRAPRDLRIRRAATRLSSWTRTPGLHGIVAVHRDTGDLMGFAGWRAPDCPGFVCQMTQAALLPHSKGGHDIRRIMGWSDQDIEEMWKGVNVQSWEAEFGKNDAVRREELGTERHWYLAPLFVNEEFRGRGVGRLLLDYAIKKADRVEPPTPLYLEALPNARPVYEHLGFKGLAAHKSDWALVRRGPGRS